MLGSVGSFPDGFRGAAEVMCSLCLISLMSRARLGLRTHCSTELWLEGFSGRVGLVGLGPSLGCITLLCAMPCLSSQVHSCVQHSCSRQHMGPALSRPDSTPQPRVWTRDRSMLAQAWHRSWRGRRRQQTPRRPQQQLQLGTSPRQPRCGAVHCQCRRQRQYVLSPWDLTCWALRQRHSGARWLHTIANHSAIQVLGCSSYGIRSICA